MKLRFNLVFGGFVCIVIVAAAVFAPLLAHYNPVLDADLMNAELPPDAQFWFGTDAQGRDVYSRILYGAQVSLTVGVVSQCINTVIGLCFGISAGYFGGWWDDFVNGLTNLMLAIPSLIFALAIMAVLGPGLPSLLLALGLTNWSWTCRIARSSTLSLKKQGYIQAAKMLGYSDARIMITQIVPNMIGPILVIGTLGMGDAILAEAALSYLGLGISPPDPSWGNMLTDARELIVNAPWAAVFPGLAIFFTVLGLNLFGDGLRDWLDPAYEDTQGMSEQALLEVENLRIDIVSGSSKHNVVEDVSFTIGAGETFGLVGESGCGKSITALSMIGLLRKPLSITDGVIRFKGQDLRSMSSREMRKLRGNRIAMIFQEPMTALNPLSPVGRQIAEMFVLHQGATWHEAERKAIEALASVQVPAPEQRVKNYPHQMSGGMRQRVMIAIALACDPDLLIADEPTTALDVTVQAEILRLMQELCTARGTSVLMISHDLGVIAKMCRRVGVMYAGHLVEQRITAGLFHHPAHPYAHGLLASLPQLGSRQKAGQLRLQEIEGVVPSISAFPKGCRFEPRCTRATDICRAQKPGWTPLEDAGVVRCFHHE